MSKILYLHGFASSADSTKALKLKEYINSNYLKTEIVIPDIENNIAHAVKQIDNLIKELSPSGLIGSSLGGFYATYFSEKYNLKCVGINPAVMPPADMSQYLGENKNYSTDEKFIITQEQLDLLAKMMKEKEPDRWAKEIEKIHESNKKKEEQEKNRKMKQWEREMERARERNKESERDIYIYI